MLRRSLALSVAAVLAVGLSPGAAAAPSAPNQSEPAPELTPEPTAVTDVDQSAGSKGPVLALGEATAKPELYIVQLAKPAVPAYDGGIEDIPATRPESGERLHATSAPAREYRSVLREDHAELTASIEERTGREPDVRHRYTDALNGIAVELTRAEARTVAQLPDVVAVQVDEKRQLQTDVGPEWIGAPSIWDGSGTPGSGSASKGEGVVVGIIDSGINPANPSFHDSVPESEGGDGYDHTNPRGEGNYVGVCDPDNPAYQPDFTCNDKLIGAWGYTAEPQTPIDVGGHGSHTASTAAGNQVEATTYSAPGTEFERSETRTIKGVAPHANIIAYDVCSAGCSIAAIAAAIDQAINDGVDVINYSIGSTSPSNVWSDPDTLGFLNARAAGVHVATSAGNAGPGSATVGSPADAPWITSVGATQHNRQWQARVENITADGGESLPAIDGLAFSAPSTDTYPLVYAGDAGDALCREAGLAGEDFTGQIVVCDRGVTGRVEKGAVVAELGAEGMILVNDEANGDSLNADAHALPAAHIGYDDGVALKDWMAGVEGEQASLSGGIEVIDDGVADIMAGFSSRGPNRAVDVISPSLSAPGVDILAAYGSDNAVEWAFVSGTSMASPHVAGSLALLEGVHGDAWSPAEAQSALMTTAHTGVSDNDGSDADWFDQGSGRVDLEVATRAGLVLDESQGDYLAANPAEGGDVKQLNVPSMANSQCLQICEWTRTVTGTATGAGDWTVSTETGTDGVDISVEPATFSIDEGEEVELTVTADVRDAADTEDYQFGRVVLSPEEGSEAPEAHLPVAVLPSTGVLPDDLTIDTRRDAGSQESDELEAVEITDLHTEVAGLAPAEEEGLSIPQDTTNDDPYDGNGSETVLVEVSEDAQRLVASLSESTATDTDLFVGRGEEPSAATEVCSSTTPGSDEFCDVGDPEPGTWWILVQNWQASEPDATDTVTLGSAVVAGDADNLTVQGPETNPVGEPFTIRAFYDEPALETGQTWYGAVTLGSSPDSPGDIGTIPVTLNRHGDDVSKTVSADTAEPGDTLTYTLTVEPNVTDEDLTYSITDTLPEGVTYVEGSATGGTVSDGVLTWEPTMPTGVGAEGDYAITTSAEDDACVNPFTGTAEYVDLEEYGIPASPQISGDGVAYTAFTDGQYGFYGKNHTGIGFADDGFVIFDAADNYGGLPFIPQTLPEASQPNNLAAALWQDMQIVYDEQDNAGVSLATAGDLAVIEYDDLRLYGDDAGDQGTYDVEVFAVQGSSDLVFAYDNVSGPLEGPITIGTENAAGDRATALLNYGSAKGLIEDDLVVCMEYSGPQLSPKEISYQVTVDEGVTDGQVLTNEAVHVTDNPGAQEATASTDVTVEGAEPPVVAPISVEGTQDAEEPSTDGVFTFTRPEEAADAELTVTYSVEEVRARAGEDYVALDGKVTFEAGSTTATEVVEVIDRQRRSPRGRTVTVTIDESDAWIVGDPASASVTIVDDWAPRGRHR